MKVIAEIGSNWISQDDARMSVEKAKAYGADAVKFQYFDNVALYGVDGDRSNQPLISPLKRLADDIGIEFMCTAFSPEHYLFIDDFVACHKIASAEITDIDILETVATLNKPVLLSTGGAHFKEIDLALDVLKSCEVTIMYCVTAYPARVIDFRFFKAIQERYGNGYLYGYSDHSDDVLNIPDLARYHGAVVLEKHVNFTSHTDTPDAPHSLSENEFALMVRHLKGLTTIEETFTPCSWQRVKTERGYFRPL